MHSQKQDQYPWHKTAKGESFFVPSLDPKVTVIEGKQMAVILIGHMKIKAVPCLYKGLLGVMFTRPFDYASRQAQS